jgi:ATP-binding cassette subfamily C protein
VLALIVFVIAPTVTLIALIVIGITLLLMNKFSQQICPESAAGLSDRGALAANISDHLGGLKLAKSPAAESRPAQSFQDISEKMTERRVNIISVQSRHTATLMIGPALAMCLMAWFAVEKQNIAGGQLVFIAIIGIRIVTQLNALQGTIHRLAVVIPAFQETEKIHRKWHQTTEPASTENHPGIQLETELTLTDVTYRYPCSQQDAVSELSLRIPAGSTTALCGHSGAGKSTLVDLALGLIPPSSGDVKVDGSPIDQDVIRSWRQSAAYVPQDVFLPNEIICKNLLWLNPASTEDELWAALGQASVTDRGLSLPKGLDPPVGDRGVRLSGGERQRIALARALLRKPALLVLDEATSSLDNANERLVQQAIEGLHGKTTILIIAHRLSTIRHANHIAVMQKGRIVQSGTWSELAADEAGPFAQMISAAAI